MHKMKQYKTHLSKEFPNEEFDGLYESYKKYYCVENNLASSTSHPLFRVSTYNINGFNEVVVFGSVKEPKESLCPVSVRDKVL